MPAEPRLKRRSSRKDFQDYRFDGRQARELEEKRNRGEISCAECRRLKMKCDKQIPCQSCQKRGCATLCPNGELPWQPLDRSRHAVSLFHFVLAATEHLHQRIAKLTNRIHKLELALASLQAERSSEPHPLLREELSTSHEGWEEELQEVEEVTTEAIDAFGTLSISEHGVSRFFGPTGGSESLLVANQTAHGVATSAMDTSTTVDYQYPTPSPSLYDTDPHATPALFSHSFPFTPLGTPTVVRGLIESHLPLWSAATQLTENYLAHIQWVFPSVTRGQLLDDMLPNVYRRLGLAIGIGESEKGTGATKPAVVDTGVEGEEYSGPHDLALLFIVFAIGALIQSGDHTDRSSSSNVKHSPLPYSAAGSALGEHFHQLSCAALALQSVLEKPALITIQTLYLMSLYNALGGRALTSETTIEMTWGLVNLAANLTQTIGLHRDSARWGLSPKMVQRRRMLFWDVFTADLWQSMTNGRPPSFSLSFVDCRFPDAHASEGVQREPVSAFSHWMYRFTAECVADIIRCTLTAEPPTYATVMELDRKVREFPLPEGIGGHAGDFPASGEGEGQRGAYPESHNRSFEQFIMNHTQETVLLYLHRSFFAQALIEQPTNPLKSTYASSFLASYRASSTVLKCIREHFNVWPNSCALLWIMWTFAFSSGVVFGTVVTRAPRSSLAQSAMTELEQACILFSEASVYSPRAAKALPILCKLADKARSTLAAVQAQTELLPDVGVTLWNANTDWENRNIEDDELTIFAGRARLLSSRKSFPPVGGSVVSPTFPAVSQSQQLHATNTSTAGDWSTLEPSATLGEIYMPTNTLHGPTPQYPHPPSQIRYQGHTVEHNTNDWDSGTPVLQSFCEQTGQNYPPDRASGNVQSSSAMAPPEVQEGHLHQQQYTPQHELQVPYQPHAQEYHSHSQHAYLEQQQRQPGYQAHAYMPTAELVGPGLAARDTILHARWNAFMEDSGLLEGVNFSHVRGAI